MPIDTSIIGRLMPVKLQLADPLESAHKSLALQALMGQQDMQAMQMRQAQQAEADDLATREAFKQGGDRAAIVQRLMQSGQYKPAQALEKYGLEADKARGEINKTRIEGMGKLLDFQKQAAGAVLANPTAENALQMIDQGERLATSLNFPEQAAAAAQQRAQVQALANDPEGLRRLVAGWAISADKLLPQIGTRDRGGVIESTATDPITGRPVVTASVTKNDPNKAFNLGQDGKPVANKEYQQYELTKAARGATNVSVNTANKPFLTELGKGMGESVVGDFNAARNAVQTLANAKQIEQGLGSVIAGPGANARIKLSQIGQLLGVTGADDTERLVNTRNVIQGLARQELAAAGQMKGQGQITESERGILRRAEAGQIDELTVPELRALVSAVRKTANYKIGLHKSNMDRLKTDPNAAGVVDFMRVDVPDQGPTPVDPAAVDAALKKYGQSR